MSTCRRSRFYCTCKLRLVSGFFHHRDSNRTCGNCITYRGTRNHSAKSRTDNCYLRRTTCIFSSHAVCKLDKEIRDSCSLQERTKNNKHYNILRAYIYWCGKNTFFCIKKVTYQEFHPAKKRRVCKSYSQRIDQEKAGYNQDWQTNTTSGKLNKCQNANNTDNDLIGFKSGTLINNFIRTKSEIQKCSCAKQHKNNIAYRHIILSDVTLLCRISQKPDQNDQSQERSQSNFFQEGCKKCYIDTPQ